MNPSPSPSPIDVYVHAAPADFWQQAAGLSPFAVLLSAIIAGFIAWRTLKQKTEADNRAEWWRRAEWALDAAHSGDAQKKLVGLKVLGVLGEDKLAGPGEIKVLEAAWKKPLADANASEEKAPVGPAHDLAEELRRAAHNVVDSHEEPGDNGTDGSLGRPEGGKP